jgi:hypothetical protein
LLRVARRFESHEAAAEWYQQNGITVPRNCMVSSNAPVALDQTDGEVPGDLRSRANTLRPEQIVRLWDSGYSTRAKEHGVVLVCEPIFRELVNPPKIFEQHWQKWLGRVPATQNPPAIDESLWLQLTQRTKEAG